MSIFTQISRIDPFIISVFNLLKVLYKQKWEETKDRYLLPPDAPELVLAVKNAANFSKVGPVSHSSTRLYVKHASSSSFGVSFKTVPEVNFDFSRSETVQGVLGGGEDDVLPVQRQPRAAQGG